MSGQGGGTAASSLVLTDDATEPSRFVATSSPMRTEFSTTRDRRRRKYSETQRVQTSNTEDEALSGLLVGGVVQWLASFVA